MTAPAMKTALQATAQVSAMVETQPHTKRKKVRPQNRPKFTKAQIAMALLQTRGVLSDAAEILAASYKTTCSRQTLYNALERWPDLKDQRHDVVEEMKDMAEGKLFEAIQAGEPWAVRFFLTKRGADRGYGNSTRIEDRGLIEKTVAKAHILESTNLEGKSAAELADFYQALCADPSKIGH